MLTADTITDEQIKALRDRALLGGDYSTAQSCTDARLHDSRRVRSAARARCAEILNARAAAEAK